MGIRTSLWSKKLTHSKVFIVGAEVEPLERAQGFGAFEGAVLYVFVPAQAAGEAYELAQDALEKDGYRIVNLEEAFEFRPDMEWEGADAITYRALADRALASGSIAYSEFYTWGGQ
jgi:hypothetical protein